MLHTRISHKTKHFESQLGIVHELCRNRFRYASYSKVCLITSSTNVLTWLFMLVFLHTHTHTHTDTHTHTQTYVVFEGLSIDQRTVDSCKYVPVGKSVRGHQNKWKDMANRVKKICSIITFDSREFLSKCFKMNSLRSLKKIKIWV